MISGYFIDRPIFASVISAFIVIAGLAALRVLPVAQYPDILPPEVEVQAFYPGANAETVAADGRDAARPGHQRRRRHAVPALGERQRTARWP